ncbi:MAG: CARDB domain-containing protein [Desulfuromonadaceae bacterium]|nr:CARDB domain-containing protein [Desulfuromonadaceae bacterium]MDD2849251.1 CARDB domain-containing protein [Desulfuromonadaceae bacterium]MDD4131878.1 CARDB domain-containing protein [Desulfuromonadaceae bacterium]
MIRYRFLRVLSLIFVIFGFICSNAFAAGVRIVPSNTQVTPGGDFFFDVVADGIPAEGLGGVQFRLNLAAPSGTVASVSELGQTGASDIAIVTPLLVSPAVPGRSGIGDFFWNAKGPNGILVMDNEPLINGSALYTFAHTSGAVPPSGSGTVARFAVRVGSGVTAERLDITLNDVLLLDGGPAYPLDYVTGATIQMRCMAKVPTLVGLDRIAAQAALVAAKLTLGSVYEVDNSVGVHPLNVVLEQSTPQGGDLLCQTPVNVAINSPPVDVGNVSSIDKLNDESGTVVLSWTPSNSADTAGYRVYANATLLKQVNGALINGTEAGGLVSGVTTRLKVTTYDTLGNESSGSYVDANPIDDVTPVININGIVAGSIYKTNVTPQVTVTDAGGPVTWAVTLNGSPFTIASIATDGAYTLAVSAVDQAGNHATKSISFTIDTVPPALTITTATTAVIYPVAILTGTVEEGSGLNVSSTSEAIVGTVTYPSSGSWSCPVSNLAPGLNTFAVTAIDAAGNIAVKSASITYNAGLSLVVTPSSLAADKIGELHLQINNIPTQGGEVLVEQLVDANSNGIVDAGDYVIRSFNVNDGTLPAISGVPGDDDGLINGQASVTMVSYLVNDIYHAPASYLFRATQGTSSAGIPFTVTAIGQSQSVSGIVTDGTNPLPGALVRLADSFGRHNAFAVADNAGHYTLNIANPGIYLVTPMAYGYASPAPTAVSLAYGQILVGQNLTLVTGDFHLSGLVIDDATGAGIPGVWVWAMGQSASGVALSSANGSYDLLLPAGQYKLLSSSDPAEPTPYTKGYVVLGGQSLSVNLAADSVDNDIALPKSSYYVSGKVLDPSGNTLAGIPVQAMINAASDSRKPMVSGVSDTNGTYVLQIISGDQWEFALNQPYAHLLNLIGTSIQGYSTGSGSPAGKDITAHSVTAWVQGVVKDSSNTLLGGVEVVLRNSDSSITSSAITAADGTYRIGAYEGSWFVKALTDKKETHTVAEQGVTLVDAQTATLDFIVDVTPPEFVINSVVSPTTMSSQIISGSVEADSTVVVTANTSAVVGTVTYPTTSSWSCPVTGLVVGNNVITATASDAYGNQAVVSAMIVYKKPASPDLVVTALAAPANASPEQIVRIPVTVKNQGTTAGQFYVGLYLSNDDSITTRDTLLGQVYVYSLAAGVERTYTATIKMPAKTTGTYYIGAIADNKGKINESDESNNSFVATPTVIAFGPDLIVTALAAPAKASPGQTIRIPVTVKNQGTTTAEQFHVALYLSNDNSITTHDTLLGQESVRSLAAGAELTYTATIKIPEKTTGTYYIGAIADTSGKINESDESNNSFVATPTVIAFGPDLVVTALTAPAKAYPGQMVRIPVTVKNQGSSAAGQFHVGLYLSNDNGITTRDALLGQVYVNSLAAGTELTYTATIKIPEKITGTYYIGAIADASGKINESDESNNSFVAIPTVIAFGPDLVVTALAAPANASPEQIVRIPVTVKNQGSATAGQFYVGLYLSSYNGISTRDTLLGQVYVYSLAAGVERTYTATIKMPAKTTGTYYIGAIADTNGKINESDESNNSFVTNPTVIAFGPDLVVTALSTPAKAYSGQMFRIPVTVKNQGTTTAEQFHVGLYLSNDNSISTHDTLLGQESIRSLAAGAELTYTATIKLPEKITGMYYVGAIADSKDKINESDESNNSFAANSTVIAK